MTKRNHDLLRDVLDALAINPVHDGNGAVRRLDQKSLALGPRIATRG